MPIWDRDWYKNWFFKGKHPPACTCVDCTNKRLGKSIYWRPSALASQSIQDLSQVSEWIGFDADGNLQFNLTKGVEDFTNKVLLIASECNTVIGVEVQSVQVTYFPNAELKVIEGAGHDMYSGKPEETIAVIREYLNTPQ